MRIGVFMLMVALPGAAGVRAGTDATLADQLRAEVAATWHIQFDPARRAWVATSPSHALEFGEGCVIHRQVYPVMDGKISLARMEADRLYYADAAADGCGAIAPGRFFTIQQDTEPYGALDYLRRVHRGPADGDRLAPDDLDRLTACFAPSARPALAVGAVRSRPAAQSPGLSYTAVLACPRLRPEERIFATELEAGEIAWEIRPSEPLDVDDR